MGLPPFEDVVTAHGPTVLRVCRAVVGPFDADDAWSETFLSALRAYPRLRPDSDVRAWLVTVAHRKAIDIVRARARAPIPVETVNDAPPPAGRDPVAEAAEKTDGDLVAAVRALPDKQRHVVAYRYLADLSYADIAGLVGGSEAAARRSAADGIAALRVNYRPAPDDRSAPAGRPDSPPSPAQPAQAAQPAPLAPPADTRKTS